MTAMLLSRFAKYLPLLAGLALVGVFAFLPDAAFAQATESLEEVNASAGLGEGDPRLIVARIIRAFLTVLGIIAVLLVIYGGWTWMTAAGSPEKVTKARNILLRAGIGLAIIMLSWSITTFVMRSLLDATGGGDGGDVTDGDSGPPLGGSRTSTFTVTDYSPDGAVAIRNVQLRVTFSKNLDETTVDGNIVVTNAASGEEVDGTLTANGNRVTFVPTVACPSPNEDRYCFDADTEFTVSVSSDIESASGMSLSCGSDRCTSSFTTGSIVDTESPLAVVTDPEDGDGVASTSFENIQVHATDDSEVAGADFFADDTQFDSVGAIGDDLSDVTVETVWDTSDLENGERYTLEVTVTDIAGNTDSDSVRVTARPAWCFNGEEDTDLGEEGVDCGGDASSAEYCGACDGETCSENSDCSSGSCIEGVCVPSPEIDGFSPSSGAVGTYVTISGTDFGVMKGTVEFPAEDGGTVEAEIPVCGDGWTDTQIVVEVPEGAVDGALTLTTRDGIAESTNDDNGAIFDDFDVNDTVRPKLCDLSPNGGESTDAVALTGLDFGESQGESTVSFGTTAAGSYTSWSDVGVDVTVPTLDDGAYDVAITVDGIVSNSLSFDVEQTSATPIISGIDPESGAIGEYVTISGSNFGSRIGTVWFVSASNGYAAVAGTNFPDACSEDWWGADEITIIVPDAFQNNESVSAGDYELYVETSDGSESASVDFTIEDGQPGPGICAIDPDTGLAGDTVTIYGQNLGSDGTVTFYDGVDADVTDATWEDEAVTLAVPSGVATGAVTVTVGSEESNGVNFAVGEGDETTAQAEPASYGWYFSTGAIPSTPEVRVVCETTDDGGRDVSGVPNARFTEEVCTNAVVYAEFTEVMNEGSVTDAFSVAECTAGGDEPCDTTSDITDSSGSLELTSTTDMTYVTWTPSALATSTTYQVTISTSATSEDGAALEEAVSWQFTTMATDTACVVEEVRVVPDPYTIDTQFATAPFRAQPLEECVVINADSYAWDWSVDMSYADFTDSDDGTCDGEPDDCATVVANAEGVTDVTATEDVSSTSGNAELTINFTDPYVNDYWPTCDEACANAGIGATFNTLMVESELVEGGAVLLYTCDNELCTGLTEYPSYTVDCTTESDVSAYSVPVCDELTVTPSANLTESAYYRVVVSGDVTSVSGIALTRTNYSGDFSWTFRVKEGDAVCALERTEISPSSARTNTIGDRQTFTVEPYGAPDECSVAGQRLASTDYDWSWTDPIADDGSDASIDVAEWQYGLIDVDLSNVASGCTSACTSAGSEAYEAICGDGIIGTGEECEDGGTVSGDGCSAMCLREGGDNAGTCGDATLDRAGDGSGEDCDDGNLVNGDGCSATCLNEGSNVIGSTCGNNDIAYDSAVGGEDCDDGNVTNGDGCSARCLNEGTPTDDDIGGARCGDGATTSPYENCDDGNGTSGDGCSSRCLLEGSSLVYGSSCGDTILGTGEECDEGDTESGDGCSSDCLLEGSSTAYDTPSFCGDGDEGTGEVAACEAGAGDGYTDNLQLAFIGDDAAQEVDEDDNEAVATIVVQEPISGVSASATYTLACSAASDLECDDPTTMGVGVGNCCVDRPTVTLYPNGSDTCRNAAVYGVFTEEMNAGSFTERNTDGTEQPRMYAVLDLASVGLTSCSDADGHTTLARAPTHWAARAWFAVRRFIFGASVEAAAGDCIVPVSSFTQEYDAETDMYTVYMRYSAALLADATYTLTIEGDSDYSDTSADGVLSQNGVGLYLASGTQTQTFATNSEICTLDVVWVDDQDEDSPRYFSQEDEEHTFAATAVSYATGEPQEIQSLDDVYSWSWTNWAEDSSAAIVSVAQSATSGEEHMATVTAEGENGSANVTVSALIVDDVVGSEEGTSVAGSESITAYLCENSWPDADALPWSDTDDGSDGAVEGDYGWMHFSTYFCQDDGEDGDSDDFPAIVVTDVKDQSQDEVLKEYLFKVADGSGDAIGIRIVSNEEYLSPSAWFADQGFSGSLQETTVDGFAAVTDGRTTYVAAPNVGSSGIYANIYVISYNENASTTTVDIYDQFVANLSFAVNVDDAALCLESSTSTSYATDSDGETVACASDADCDDRSATTEDWVCADLKARLQRDTKRLADMTTIAAAVDEYGDDNGACSSTTSQSCTADSDCPDDETCEPLVPTLASGTYVRALGASAWTSWEDLLGAALGENNLTGDPLNAFDGCGEGAFADYNADTCVNETTGQYACPDGSYVYHYRARGSESYELYADLEYTADDWVNAIDADTDDAVEIVVGNSASTADGFTSSAFCDGDAYGSDGDSCGDGVIQSGEDCELGDTGGTATTCNMGDGEDNYVCGNIYSSSASCTGPDDTSCSSWQECVELSTGSYACIGVYTGRSTMTSCDGFGDDAYCQGELSSYAQCVNYSTSTTGTRDQVCNATCSGWEDDTDGACVSAECGDGVTDASAGETCDDGDYNGRYGYCGSLCTYDSATYCGDGALSGGEVCDCGASSLGAVPSGARPYGGTPDTCAGVNGTYNANEATTCAWDCRGPASSCGDGTVDSGEVCDGDTDTWEGALCDDGETACTTDADCPSGGVCGDNGYTSYACPVGNVCVGGDYDGMLCNGTDWSGAGVSFDSFISEVALELVLSGVCESGGGECDVGGTEYQTYHTRSCDDDSSTSMCTWNSWEYCNAGGQSCGNGTVDGDEECDDGNDTATDECTTACTLNVCGDGVLYVGEEQCDEGSDNGQGCDASYESSCQACSTSCRNEASSGEFCGDGVINGTEYCDASDVPYAYYHTMDETIYAACNAGDSSIVVSGETYICDLVGVCNGGFDNGEYCITDGNCYNHDCVFPTCSASCASTCPLSYSSTSLLLTSNEPGADASGSANLYSYDASTTSDLPNAATITIPACTVISGLTADISLADVDLPQTYIVFITDLSMTMDYVPESDTLPTDENGDGDTDDEGEDSRLEIAQASMESAAAQLYDELGSYASIAAVGYKGLVAGRCYLRPGVSCASDSDCTTSGDVCNDETTRVSNNYGPVASDSEADLVAEILSYITDPWGPSGSRDSNGVLQSTNGHGTFTYEALVAARELFEATGLSPSTDNVRFIGVLLSDGEFTNYDPIIEARNWDYLGYELYTGTIGSDTDFIAQMNNWSSNSYDGLSSSYTADSEAHPLNGIDYSYVGTTETEVEEMYQDIIDSILSMNVTVVSADDSDTDTDSETTTGTVSEGSGVSLPWPEGFVCDPYNEQDLPVRFDFEGEGQMEVSNVRIEYCAP